ncbi:hypothetical protein GH714_011945 [Hevea brasiliensis]|uniref:Helicase C-terminal domain-containing protein n=1 Tax=Hevea brasiliensis TaxID=3981 RepID=A0A6A6LFU8_HEVBR|nr:hypothetical protein GH714_011945 [Hevea brasiliensis]
MNYEQRLIAAATLIVDADARAHDAPINATEIGVTATLKPHQVEGVSWLIRRYLLGVNVILEMAKFTPKLKVLRYVGDKEHRRSLRKTLYEHVKEHPSSNDGSLLPFDVLLTTYDVALMDQDFLSQIPWHYAIIDEAQRLKNPSSVLYNILKECFLMPRRLLMTGTPIQNNLTELWALMHFCMPSVFGTHEQFLSTFKEAGDPTSDLDAAEVKRQLKNLKCIMTAFMLRRTKSKLIECGNLVLPPLTEITVMAPLVSLQKRVYASILRKELPKLLALSSAASNNQSLQNIVIQLRKACSHPYLFPGIEPEPFEEGEHLVQVSGKLLILDQLLQKLHDSGHRVLLFAQMTHTLDILQDFLELRKYSYERLDGSVRAEERFAAIRSFSGQLGKLNSEFDKNTAFVFMISTRAGGVGLNLVAADTVIFYEQDWNPQVDKQALQRAHRIGQINHVLSINLVTMCTVEEVLCGEQRGNCSLVIMFTGKSDELNMPELNAMTAKVIAMRDDQRLGEIDRKYVVNRIDQIDAVIGGNSAFANYDQGLDEASYQSCYVDNSGNWGHGGMFDALAKLSSSIPDAYQRASEFGDLHLGDLHLIRINGDTDRQCLEDDSPQWVALAVVQSYNPRRKVPRSNISILDLERCLNKVSFAAAQNSGIIIDDHLEAWDVTVFLRSLTFVVDSWN